MSSSVWSRPAPPRRPALTREAIVAAAIALADAEGLAAVSIRRVAAELGARTMTLYSYIERKEDLLALMLDEIAGELRPAGPPPDDWREALLDIARRERDLVRRHPWRVDLLSQGVAVGPNALRHVERKLAVLARLGAAPEAAWRVLAAYTDYMTGFLVREAQERGAPRHEGVSDAERAALAEPYVRELIGEGALPHLAPLLEQGVAGAGDTFEQGLRWLFDGIERELSPE
ncbi:TetR/AcrR family transcriptional regulator [Actinomadura sp. ATCC 31491]|uniref:TetR/AcrR family transcriptional regulator n=1 Tax=Actinomadura luzonensis TaxID=2805427 RepID=A0ABT0G1A3_9ACTN|nr:TetR/AcrR family transcriptional regulator [Actinomadura luzonensis]MCK2217876.1 TetR/AcrR family transcriptional regulator [Actinomadura luzonensis]